MQHLGYLFWRIYRPLFEGVTTHNLTRHINHLNLYAVAIDIDLCGGIVSIDKNWEVCASIFWFVVGVAVGMTSEHQGDVRLI